MQDVYVSEESDEECNEQEQINSVKERVLKGIKLPKNKDQWNIANDFFKVALPVNDPIENINDSVQTLQRIVYNYFKSNYGNVGSNIEEFSNTYDNMSRNQFKKALKQLKESNDSPEKEIVYVSKLLRSKFGKKGNKLDVFKQELKFKENFWKFCKSNLETKKDQMGVPTFDEKKCYNHFRNTCKAKHRNKHFDFPSWMKLLHEPTSCFNQEPPKYQEIANIIKKMGASSSPCPFDQITVLVLKKCPIV